MRRSFLRMAVAGLAVVAASLGAAEAKTYRIAISNGWVGSEWRSRWSRKPWRPEGHSRRRLRRIR
jgi:ABC-type sugar transport system substrate-binding protein